MFTHNKLHYETIVDNYHCNLRFLMHIFLTKGLLTLTALISLSAYAFALEVEVTYPTLEEKNLEIELTGTVKALNDAQITSLEEGTVKAVLVQAGDKVAKGQVLLTLDDALAKLKLQQAQAMLQSAQVKYQEDLRLYNEIVGLTQQEVTAKTLLEERRANAAISKAMLAQAESALALQQEILSRHQVKAPFAGTIAQRNIDVGEWVSQQSKVFQLVSSDNLRIFIDVPQEYFNDVNNAGQVSAKVTPDSAPHQSTTLAVSQFIGVSNPLSRTFKARIDLPASTALVSGMSARVQLALPSQQINQVQLPKTALKRHPDGNYSVYAVIDNKVKRYGVKMLRSSFNTVTVQGVPKDSAIITSGSDLLIEGSAVTIVKR